MSNTKLAVDNKSVSVSFPLKPKVVNVYIHPFKRNHKEIIYFAWLDKGKSFDIDIEVSKPMFKPTVRVQKKYVFVPICHICGVVGHIRPKLFFVEAKTKA